MSLFAIVIFPIMLAPSHLLTVPEDLFTLEAGETFDMTRDGTERTLTIYGRSWEYGLKKVEYVEPANGLVDWLVLTDEGTVLANGPGQPSNWTGYEREPGQWEIFPEGSPDAPDVPYSTVLRCETPSKAKPAVIEIDADMALVWDSEVMAGARPCDRVRFTSPSMSADLIINSAHNYGPGNFLWMGHVDDAQSVYDTRFTLTTHLDCHTAADPEFCWRMTLDPGETKSDTITSWSQSNNGKGGVYPIHRSESERRPISVDPYEFIGLED